MKELYEKSILELRKLKKLPTWREWNKIAKEKNLMSYISMRTFAGKSFNLIYRDAKRELEKELLKKLFNNKEVL